MCARAKHTHIDTETSLIWCTCTLNKIKQLLCGVFFFEVLFFPFGLVYCLMVFFSSSLYYLDDVDDDDDGECTFLFFFFCSLRANSKSVRNAAFVQRKMCVLLWVERIWRLVSPTYWYQYRVEKIQCFNRITLSHHFCYSQVKAGTQSYINYFTLLIFDEMTKKYV